MRTYFPVLTIAGSDCSGGAGIEADIKTISAIGCYAMSAITAITAQNTTGVRSIMPVTAQAVTDQIDMIFEDIPPMAVKIGMLFDAEITAAVADRLKHYRPANLVVDPVMISTSGSTLLKDEAVEIMTKEIFQLSTLVTPNRNEVLALTGTQDIATQIKCLRQLGCNNILLKGGDSDSTDFKTDILYIAESDETIELKADAIDTRNTHGTGCTLSSAIASLSRTRQQFAGRCEQGETLCYPRLAGSAHGLQPEKVTALSIISSHPDGSKISIRKQQATITDKAHVENERQNQRNHCSAS